MAIKRKSKKETKEEVTEFFEVEKDGGEKIVKAVGEEEEKTETKNQGKEENKILRNIFIIIGVLIILIFVGYLFVKSATNFEYKGVEYKIVKEGDLILYQTSFPVMYDGRKIPYNIYLRNDPRKLEDVSFNGEINLKKDMVINATGDLNCQGYGVIAIANLAKIGIFGVNVIKDSNATCDESGRYMFLQIRESNESSIEQTGVSCYNLNVNNCEVLKVTEKFMTESFAKIKEVYP
ncbi:MAG: hypothetical protein AABX28_00635 [Nanoarchaeota archaeon]